MLCVSVLLVIALTLTNGVVSEKGKTCTTPDDKSGICISVHKCKSILTGIKSKNDTAIEIAKKSQCGFANEHPLVCCDKNEVNILQIYEDFLPGPKVCGISSNDAKIISGIISLLAQYPWMVALEYKNKATGKNEGIKCSGTLINKRYVLTAASCLSDEKYELTNVRLGEWDLATDPDCETFAGDRDCVDSVSSVKIDKIVKHPDYDGQSRNNIGLVRMETRTKYSEIIVPVCLPYENMPATPVNTSMVISGWKTDGSASQLHQMSVHEFSRDDCKNGISSNRNLDINKSCAINWRSYYDPCFEDTGIPFVRYWADYEKGNFNFYQVGILAWNEGCNSSQPMVYTNVANYMPWILHTISEK